MKNIKWFKVGFLSAIILIILSFGGNPSANAANPGDVIINEIMQNPSVVADSNGEWFELYNPTNSDIDIDGWTILDNDIDSHVINNGGSLIIPAGGFLVLGKNSDTGTNGGFFVDYVYVDDWYLSNSADEVILLDEHLNEIDRVEYDGGPAFPDPNGASMALRDPTLDNNLGDKWCISSTPFGDGDFGTPGETNDCINTNEPPDCSQAVPSIENIWPPNHKFVSVSVLGVTDPDGDPVIVSINNIFQDEPVNTHGGGNSIPDAYGVGTDTAEVRAERLGTKMVPGNGRIYHIGFFADDGMGGSCQGEVIVRVPHDQRHGSIPIDDGPIYDSTIP